MKFYKQNLRHLREAKGMTQEDLADALGVRKQAVTHWEKGNNSPKPSRIEQIAKVIGCSVGELSDLDDKNPVDTFAVVDEKLSFIIDNWNVLSMDQKSEIAGMVRIFAKINKKENER